MEPRTQEQTERPAPVEKQEQQQEWKQKLYESELQAKLIPTDFSNNARPSHS